MNANQQNFDLAAAESLFDQYTEQSTFAEMELLKHKIGDEVDAIKSAIERNLAECGILKARAENEELERKQGGLFNRLFVSRAEYERLIKTIKQIESQIATLENAAKALKSRASICPTNKEEKRAIINILRQQKKELALEKKTRSLEMRQIRATARQSQARLGYAGYGKVARFARASIRTDKENKIAPHEAEKQRLDLMIVEIDKLIIFVEQITE